MGDISEIRGLVTIVSFLGILVLLLLQIPSDLYIAEAMREVDTPSEWQGIDIQSFQDTWNETTIYDHTENFGLGGRNLAWTSYYPGDFIALGHRYGFGLLIYEPGFWYDRAGIQISESSTSPGYPIQEIDSSDLNGDYSTYGDIQFTVKFKDQQRFQVKTFFDYNETTYSNATQAWANDELNVLIGINFDDIATSYNAWDLIAMLLFFQLPMIHPILNGIIAFPLWVAIAYLVYVLIIKVIPLIAGG